MAFANRPPGSLVVAAMLVVVPSACGGGSRPAAVGRVAIVAPGRVPSLASCLRRFGSTLGRARIRRVIARVGVLGRSLTFRIGGRLFACDGRPRGGWCASSVGVLRRVVLADGRLTLTCRSRRGRPIAFAWFQPLPAAFRILAGPPCELEAAAGRLPVRVTSTDVSGDSATFRLVQYARDGHELERRKLVLRVAG
jgi:hypothetical protein